MRCRQCCCNFLSTCKRKRMSFFSPCRGSSLWWCICRANRNLNSSCPWCAGSFSHQRSIAICTMEETAINNCSAEASVSIITSHFSARRRSSLFASIHKPDTFTASWSLRRLETGRRVLQELEEPFRLLRTTLELCVRVWQQLFAFQRKFSTSERQNRVQWSEIRRALEKKLQKSVQAKQQDDLNLSSPWLLTRNLSKTPPIETNNVVWSCFCH